MADVIGIKALKDVRSVQAQLDQAIIDGDQLAETQQARVDTDGDPHATLKARIDSEVTELRQTDAQLAAQLAQTASHLDKTKEDVFYSDLINHKQVRPMLLFTDDDTRNELYTKLYPVVLEKQIPLASAAVTNRIGNDPQTITLEQFREMQQSGLVTYMSHTENHENLNNLTLEQAEKTLRDSKKWLDEQGVDSDYFVAPFGAQSEDVRKIIRKYYKGAFRTLNGFNVPPLNTYAINRYSFEDSLESHKSRLDSALQHNRLIVIAIHAHYEEFSQEKLRDIVDYARSIGVEIVDVKTAIRTFGNIVDLGEGEEGGVIDALGNFHGKFKPFTLFSSTGSPEADITFYNKGITINHFNQSLATYYNLPTTGTILIFRPENDSFSFQILYSYRSASMYYRSWNGTDWSDWESYNEGDAIFTRGANSPITSFSIGETLRHYTTSQASTDGLPSGGVLKVVRPTSDNYAYQILQKYRSVDRFYRYWNETDWSDWEPM